jgi:hypothetical protein
MAGRRTMKRKMSAADRVECELFRREIIKLNDKIAKERSPVRINDLIDLRSQAADCILYLRGY